MRRHSLADVSRRTARNEVARQVSRVRSEGASRYFDQLAARERLSTCAPAADARGSGARRSGSSSPRLRPFFWGSRRLGVTRN